MPSVLAMTYNSLELANHSLLKAIDMQTISDLNPIPIIQPSVASADTNTLIIPIILTAAATAIFTYLFTWKLAHDARIAEQRNIAQALYIDISQTEDHFNSALSDFNDQVVYFIATADLNILLNTPQMLWDPRPYYTENNAYFAFQKDISKFDSDLSAKLYSYYLGVMNIEFKRGYINNCVLKEINRQFLPSEEIGRGGLYMRTMIIEMKSSIKESEAIKKELREKYQLNLELPRFYKNVFNTKTYSIGGVVHQRDREL